MRHLPWLNKIYYDYSARNNLRGAGFSRWAGWGDHRHPIQFQVMPLPIGSCCVLKLI